MSPIVEIKNLNSFKFIEQALAFEEKRLRDDYKNWPKEKQKITRGFDSKKGITFEQRRKEEAADYRYFPEPDIPPFSFSSAEIEKIKSSIPELPKEKIVRYIKSGIREDVAEKISKHYQLAEYLESSEELKHDIAVFVAEEVPKIIDQSEISFAEYQKRVPISKIADLINFVGNGIISKTVAKDVFTEMVKSDKVAAEIIKEKGLEQVSDSGEIGAAITEVLGENPDLVKKYQSGKTQVAGFLIGQVMRKTAGKANPQIINKLLVEKINGLSG
ncbi:MAG: aspartyl-tRNA(Asn)/glutamyl-tRNA (Gln) amidotransferase subunit B [Candidatus Berkelbacteria bacterium Athens1014_28]|uniref:Aspartyl-tRNA(Asn)/glutamyl-tRNA (Gln) amidotransferase subunit B n=1 Tax=Candidatus Berkelbacteria bacterium Athens1014_28 TaxID=2017145 RepID=A0A554LM82_9BACT|nr:MAG: aspartyl-tRNA(Asn)/glutamyl-tRNA (Gln) amidotransferase subunit B [Candidatus Berkelbacteria bacterium Athens1014_28]